jgi:lysophospholipase L1-like esterase
MNRLSLRKKLIFAGVTTVLSVFIAFFSGEVYLRLTRPNTDLYAQTGRVVGPNPLGDWAFVDAFCAYRPKPGQHAEGKTVNSHGFFSTPELTPDKPEGAVRIAFLGESSTAGTAPNLADAETWPWRTVELLKEQIQSPVDFINAAVSGYSSFESYGRLWSRIRHFSPDIVVVYHGWNEMYYFERSDDIVSWRTRPDGSWSIAKTTEPVAHYAPHWFDPMIRWSQTLSRIRIRLSRPLAGELGTSKSEPLSKDFDRDAVAIWRTNLRLLRGTCELMGAKLFVAKQATLVVPGLTEDQRSRCRYEFHGFDHDAHVEAFAEIYRIIDEEMPEDSIIDLTRLSGRPDLFFDHIHPTPLGCGEIASVVARSLATFIESGRFE